MTGHEWEIAILVLGAVVTGLVSTLFRRAEKTGERMGRLERQADFDRGFKAGYKAAKRETKHGG